MGKAEKVTFLVISVGNFVENMENHGFVTPLTILHPTQ
jgi:hypothetical protein